jgi:serine/threonine protein phosphatase PrpC
MFSYLKTPQLTKKTTIEDGSTFFATRCEMQGWRSTMEDAVIYEQLTDNLDLFAICDGHGGA